MVEIEEKILDIKTGDITGKVYFPPSFKDQIIEIIKKYVGFLFVPGKSDAEIELRNTELYKNKSKRSFLRKMRSPLTILGIIIVFIIVSWAIFAPWISPYSFDEVTGVLPNAFGPSDGFFGDHPMGLTFFGRDVYGRLIWGARSSLTVGLTSIFMSIFFGMILGLIAAYYGGIIDNIIMRIMDVFLAFPSLILAIVLISIFSPQMKWIMLAYGILGIPGYARLMRGAALQEINKPYVHAARVSGASNLRIIFAHILPNCIAPLIVSFTFDIGGIILSLAGLGFLGFGDPNLVEWGYDISQARGKIYVAPWAALYPGLGILIAVLGFMLLGDGLRDALDPRIKH